MLYNPDMNPAPDAPRISVVIPNYDGAACLEACLKSLVPQLDGQAEAIVVDNASRDGSLDVVRRTAPQARILPQERNLGFAGAVNRGANAARGEWIAVLNNDTEVAPDWLAECHAAIARHPDAAFLACRILDSGNPGRIYSAGDCFLRAGIGYRRGQELADGPAYREEGPVFSACGCAALIRRVVFLEARGYDERFFAYLEDVDLGLRLQAAGFRGYYIPGARVFHIGGATSGGEFAPLAVRLRTRNALLLLVKSVPAGILLRSLPMVLAMQISWFGRAVRHGRLGSYLRGLGGAAALAPAMWRSRRETRPLWRQSGSWLWKSILASENLARRDFMPQGEPGSRFLAWYFRWF